MTRIRKQGQRSKILTRHAKCRGNPICRGRPCHCCCSSHCAQKLKPARQLPTKLHCSFWGAGPRAVHASVTSGSKARWTARWWSWRATTRKCQSMRSRLSRTRWCGLAGRGRHKLLLTTLQRQGGAAARRKRLCAGVEESLSGAVTFLNAWYASRSRWVATSRAVAMSRSSSCLHWLAYVNRGVLAVVQPRACFDPLLCWCGEACYSRQSPLLSFWSVGHEKRDAQRSRGGQSRVWSMHSCRRHARMRRGTARGQSRVDL